MLNEKKLAKIIKIIGADVMTDINATNNESIKERIVALELEIKAAQEELESNPKYDALREDLKALSAGMKELKARHKAVVAYCLHVLEQRK